MKKKQITYGVYGMMEYQAVVKVGKKNVSINFSDGSISAMGTNPATFTTDNIIIQNAIEASNDFKRGRITTVRSIDLEEELQIFRNAPIPVSAEAAAPHSATPTENEAPAKNEETGAEASAEVREEAAEVAGEPAPLTQVEFSCNDDAKDFLEQKFGYVRSKLRNREDITAAAKAHGIEIIFV